MDNGLQIYQKRQERYLSLMTVPEVIGMYNSLEKRVIDAALKDTVEIMSDDFLTKKVETLTQFICMDLGIKDRHNAGAMQYINTRFFTIIKQHFPDFTIQDIKLAFELLEIGTLDKWLPTNQDNSPNREHYQSFNVKFYSKVLIAYRHYKAEIFGRGQRFLFKLKTGKPNIISQNQRDENTRVTLNDIYDAFNIYKFKSVEPNFILSIFIDKFVERGLIEQPKYKSLDLEAAKIEIIENRLLSAYEKKDIITKYHKGNIPSQIKNSAQIKANNKAMKEYFDKLINEDVSIKDVLK